jgi:hypothetical protein
VANQESKQIICTAYGKGREHDFKLFKSSKIHLYCDIEFLGDRGYQGIQKIHKNSLTPQKRKRGEKLTKVEKKKNRELAKRRVVIEHIYRHLKLFKILSLPYRNRRKRFGLRFNLIAGFYNYELHLRKNN